MDNAKILIVEDEIGIANFIIQGLEEENMALTHAMNGEDALLKINQDRFDLILLDWMILNISGIEVCKAIRNSDNPNEHTPIIFITAKDTVEDTVEGLNAGANDYIKKPFDFNELLARINVYLRKNNKKHLLWAGNIVMETLTHQTYLDMQQVELTLKEFELFSYLLKNRNRICTRKEIIENVWDIHFDYDTSVIDVFVNAIRKKLNLKKDDPRLFTIRGVGYISKDV